MPKKRVIDNSIWKDCFNLFPTNGSKSYVDKYAPKKFQQFISTGELKDTLKYINKDFSKWKNHYLFHGSPGVGKTSIVRCFIENIPNNEAIRINGNDLGNFRDRKHLNQMYNFLTDFLTTTTITKPKTKIVWFENFDNVKKIVQEDLANHHFDLAGNNTKTNIKFLLTLNNIKDVIAPIKSRCKKWCLDFDDEDEIEDIKEQQEKKMLEILKKEKVKTSPVLKKSIKKIIKENYPDFRSCLIELEEKVNMTR